MRVGRVLRPPQPQRQALIAGRTFGGGDRLDAGCSIRSGFHMSTALQPDLRILLLEWNTLGSPRQRQR